MKKIITSEAVRLGHPDLLSDYIADSIVSSILQQDPTSRVAMEVLTSKNAVVLSGEVTTDIYCDFPKLVTKAVGEVGYETPEDGLSPDCAVLPFIVRQSPDINLGVKGNQEDQGAGDQGMQIGYATNETPSALPMPMHLCQVLLDSLDKYYNDKADGKVQVSVLYEDDVPVSVETVVMSLQHKAEMQLLDLQNFIEQTVMLNFVETLSELGLDSNVKSFLFNPTGRFVEGGPYTDTGVTGRKLAAAGYGGVARIGGGALSGKDPSKVDRSAAYYTRYVAKSLVASGFCSECEITVAYAIGVPEPVSLHIETFSTEQIPLEEIYDKVYANFSFRPYDMINELDLLSVDYRKAVRNHFWNQELPWEQVKYLT